MAHMGANAANVYDATHQRSRFAGRAATHSGKANQEVLFKYMFFNYFQVVRGIVSTSTVLVHKRCVPRPAVYG
jgi:hypothetical protein